MTKAEGSEPRADSADGDGALRPDEGSGACAHADHRPCCEAVLTPGAYGVFNRLGLLLRCLLT